MFLKYFFVRNKAFILFFTKRYYLFYNIEERGYLLWEVLERQKEKY